MATSRKTSARVAKVASKVLRSSASKQVKIPAASALSQRAPKAKKR